MEERKSDMPDLSENSLMKSYEELKAEIQKSIKEKYPLSYYYDTQNNLMIKNIDEIEGENPSNDSSSRSEGRGGNNCAENLKKSIKSVIKSKLPSDLYLQFQENFIKKYELKSQKENYVLIFMLLHQFVGQKKLRPQLIGEVKDLVKNNIQKYIRNSSVRIDERTKFHSKNIQQFEKYLEFDIDFMRKRDFEEIQKYISHLFLRKKAVAAKSIEKVRNIIMENQFLKEIFFSAQTENMIKPCELVEVVEKIKEQNRQSDEL